MLRRSAAAGSNGESATTRNPSSSRSARGPRAGTARQPGEKAEGKTKRTVTTSIGAPPASLVYGHTLRLSNPGRIAVTVKMLSERPAPQQARQRGCRSCPLRGRTRATEGIGKASPRGAPAAVLRRCLVAALDVSRRGLARRGGLSLTPYHLHLPAPRTVHWSGPEPKSQLGQWIPAFRDPSTHAWWVYYYTGSEARAQILAKSAQSILQKILTDQCDTLCVRINNVIDLPDPVPEEDDDSYNCMNVDFDRYVVAGIFSQDALDKVAEEEELVFPGSKVRVLGPAARKLAQMVIHTRFGHLCCQRERTARRRRLPCTMPARCNCRESQRGRSGGKCGTL
jgi:hypothetical protein